MAGRRADRLLAELAWPPLRDRGCHEPHRAARYEHVSAGRAFKISIKTTVGGCSDDGMVQSVRAVARQLDEVQRNTARFLAFTLSSDRTAKTALFTMCVDEDDPVEAVAAAYSWVVTAINATGDGAYGWEMAARPEERERIHRF
jgi:hypothetical protein